MSKKKIIAIVSIIVLMFTAGISVGVFLYGRGESAAVDGSQVDATTDQNQENDGNQSIIGDQTDDNNENLEQGDENTETPEEGVADGAEDDEATDNDAIAGDEDNAGITTDTNVNEVGETTISRVEEQERLVSEAFWDWWMPMDVTLTKSNVNVNLPQITVEKFVRTPVAGNEFVYVGQEIEYVIDVTNNSDIAVEDIEITDKIPENTTFVSMEDIILENEESVKGTTVINAQEDVIGVKSKFLISKYFNDLQL